MRMRIQESFGLRQKNKCIIIMDIASQEHHKIVKMFTFTLQSSNIHSHFEIEIHYL